LYLVYREQVDAPARLDRGGPSLLLLIHGLGMVVFVGLLVALVRPRGAPMEWLHFVLPGAALSAFVVWGEWSRRERSRERVRRLVRAFAPFTVGLLAPLAVFVLAYLVDRGWNDLWRGLVVLPRRRLQSAAIALPPLWTLRSAIPYVVVLAWPAAFSTRIERIALAIVVPLLAVLALMSRDPAINAALWDSVRPICPAVVVAGCVVLRGRLTPKRRAELMLLLSVAALTSLIQFPYSLGVYYAYVAPFVVLAATAVVMAYDRAPVRLHLAVAIFYVAFAVISVHRQTTDVLAGPSGERAILSLDRAGLEVSRNDEALYARLVAEIQRHSAPGAFIYAAPDCPQLYFLSARRNPTRTMNDFFDPDFENDPRGRTDRILRALEAKEVQVVVINWRPAFTPSIDVALVNALRRRYPNGLELPPFSVLWRG
jgi:hypothetical protein